MSYSACDRVLPICDEGICSETPVSITNSICCVCRQSTAPSGGAYGSSNQLKRNANAAHPQQPPVKKPKLNYLKDLSTADAAKYATLAEYEFFDQVSKIILKFL